MLGDAALSKIRRADAGERHLRDRILYPVVPHATARSHQVSAAHSREDLSSLECLAETNAVPLTLSRLQGVLERARFFPC
jgi:hypothetical protein